MREAIAGRLVGTKVARVEDPRLLTGTGRYVDDVTVPGMLHAHFVRSPFAHAVIRGIDVDAARRLPGVVAVYTGADMRSAHAPVHGLPAAPRPLPPRVLRPRRRPRARRRRSGRADHRRHPLRRRGRGAARGGRLRGAGADRDHRARARSVAPGHLARARGQRDAARPAPTTATSTPRSRAPTASCASGSSSTATPTSRWRRAAASPRSTRWRARCSTTPPRRTPTS